MLQENLKKLMIKNGHMSVSKLAKTTGLPQPTLYQLCTGVTDNPRQKTLKTLASYFSVTTQQLLGKEPLPQHLPEHTKTALELNTAPLLNWHDLLHWPNQINYSSKKEIFLDNKPTPNTFALTMPNNSMAPIFPNGCILIFDPEKPAEDKDCALVLQQASQQFIFRQIQKKGKHIALHAINPENKAADSIQLAANDQIIATLSEARLSF